MIGLWRVMAASPDHGFPACLLLGWTRGLIDSAAAVGFANLHEMRLRGHRMRLCLSRFINLDDE